MTAAAQLAAEIGDILCTLAPFIGHDEQPGVAARCAQIVGELTQDIDDRLAAEACLSVMWALWTDLAPEGCGHAAWWRTPLGRLCARSLGRDDAEAVTHSVAAAMLGVTKGTIAQLVHRGTLDRHPDGGVLRASVLQRLSR